VPLDITTAKLIVRINQAAHARGALSIWTVYDHPSDFPDTFMARCFKSDASGSFPTPTVMTGDLETIRETLQWAGLVCLMRNESDDPKIVETWI
jgi:hypothetical protein